MFKIISVIGPTSSGKSTLCKKLSKKTGWPVINEFDKMPEEIVNDLNNDPESLRLQMWFRDVRIDAYERAKELAKTTNVIMDTCFLTSMVHINLMPEGENKETMKVVFDSDLDRYPLPDHIYGIMCDESQIYKFYKKRNADYEQADDIFEHYKKIRHGYKELYEIYPSIVQLDTNGLDIVNSVADFNKIYQIIQQNLMLGSFSSEHTLPQIQ